MLCHTYCALQAEKQAAEAAARAAEDEAPPTLPAAGGPRGTLIVCPLSVLSGWQMQLEEHTAGNLKASRGAVPRCVVPRWAVPRWAVPRWAAGICPLRSEQACFESLL